MAKAMTRQAIESEKTKERICQAAFDLFLEYGYKSTTIKDICERANVSSGTIYHFFRDKADILSQNFMEILKKVSPLLDRTDEHLSDPCGTLRNFGVRYADEIEANGRELMLHTVEANSNKVHGVPVEQMDLPPLYAFIEAARTSGSLPSGLDSSRFAESLLVIFSGCIYEWMYFPRNEHLRDQVTRIFDFLYPSVMKSIN